MPTWEPHRTKDHSASTTTLTTLPVTWMTAFEKFLASLCAFRTPIIVHVKVMTSAESLAFQKLIFEVKLLTFLGMNVHKEEESNMELSKRDVGRIAWAQRLKSGK